MPFEQFFFVIGIPPVTADACINDYRTSSINSSNGVYYEYADIMNYLSNVFGNIIKKQPIAPSGYRWSIGFYNAFKNSRLTFFVAPVLVNNNPPDGSPRVLDCVTNPEYFSKNIVNDITFNPSFIFDEGHLWP